MAMVASVACDGSHRFSKTTALEIRLVMGLGVAGDAHMGETVKHRSRVKSHPNEPNLRQVHLIQSELFEDLAAQGFRVAAGDLGENITTQGIDLLALPEAARLRIGAEAVIEITGLRNPCIQIDRFQRGLMKATLDRDAAGNLVRKAGVMAVVIQGGDVRPGDSIAVDLPAGHHRPLKPV